MPTTMRARAVTPSRATTRATTKKRTEATRRVARAVTTTTRAVRDGDEVRDEGRAPWVTRVPMGREARRARGREGKTREGGGGVRVKFVRVKFVRVKFVRGGGGRRRVGVDTGG